MAARYTLTGPIGSRATLGLIALQADETIEADFRRLFPQRDVATYVTRVPSGADLTPGTLGAMEAELPRAAGLLPPSLHFDVIGYGCTSGAMVIGADRVAALIGGAARVGDVTDPLSALLAAIAALDVSRIAVLSPYIASVSAPLCAALERGGARVVATDSFDERVEARVARIDPVSIRDAALALGRRRDVQAVVLSCTNLRTLDIIDTVEAETGKPVIVSNPALAWHMARLAGIRGGPAFGRLMRMTADR